MTSRVAYLGIYFGFVVLVGCGGEDRAAGLKQTGGAGGKGGGASGGSGGSGAANTGGFGAAVGGTAGSGGSTGGTGGTGGSTEGGPDVKITSPASAADPNTGEVVVGDKADV